MKHINTNLLDLNTVAFKLLIPRCVPVDVVHPVDQLDLQAHDTSANIVNTPGDQHIMFGQNEHTFVLIYWCICNSSL